MRTLSKAQWKKVGEILAREALHAARLLGGEIPEDIESAFAKAGHTLFIFPSTGRDLVTDCSCPDWSNPCKHIAAVCYLLGEEFDRDPFLIFQLRGMSRSGLLDLLHETPSGKGSRPSSRKGKGAAAAEDAAAEDGAAERGAGTAPGALLPARAEGSTLARRLGSFPFWRGQEAFLEAMDRSAGIAAEEVRRVLAALAEASARPEWTHS